MHFLPKKSFRLLLFCNTRFLGGGRRAAYFYRKFFTGMKINKKVNDQDEPSTRTELEKLLEQKQDETEALKRLIHILGKNDPDKNNDDAGKPG
jgi:hypothetical protein